MKLILRSIARLNNTSDLGGKHLRPFLLALAVLALILSLKFETAKALPCTPGPHNGAIAADQLWCVADNPHSVTATVTVNAGVTLTLQPGVQVVFNSGTSLVVNGTLSAVGNSGATISFSSAATFTSLSFGTASTATLDYCDISHAAGSQGAVWIQSSNVTINHCAIHDNAPGNGAIFIGYTGGTGLTPTIQNTSLMNNANYPVYHYSFDIAPVYHNLTFSGNGTDAVFLGSGSYNRSVTLDSRELGGKPYVTSGSVTVNSGHTLTLAPGTLLKMASASYLTINGGATLSAAGTAEEPITITSTNPSDPAANFRAIQLGTSSTATFSHCDISRAGESQGVLNIASSAVSVNDCTIHDNAPGNGAIFLNAAGISPTVQHTSISNNSNYAIYHNTFDVAPVYHDLTFTGNGMDAVYLYGGTYNRDVTLDSREIGNKPFIAGASMAVAGGNTLTLAPGTELRFPQSGGTGMGLTISTGAELIAEGNPTEKVVVTSTPPEARYSTHVFQTGSSVSLSYCDISHASVVQGALSIYSSTVKIDHCAIHDNSPSLGAIWLAQAGISPTIQNTTFQNNTGYPIYQNTGDMAPLYLNLAASGNGTDVIAINSGNLTTGRKWSIGQSGLEARVINGDLTISASAFLSLDPGTTLRFGSNLGLNSYGSFYAIGSAEDPITITGTAASPGAWRGLNFNSGSSAIMNQVDLSYGGSGQGILRIGSSNVTLQNSQVHHSSTDGIQVSNNTQPRLNYNQIRDNVFGLRNQTPATVVTATNNWWGDASGPNHPTLNPAGIGNAVSDGVLFSPWLAAPELFGELPVGLVYLDLVSQTRASPGQPVAYAIWYDNFSPAAVTDAVLVLSLPNTAQYKGSSGGGIFWPARNQVFWKLGTLEVGESGAVAVQAVFEWGIPDLTLEASMAVMLGSGLASGQLVPADYLTYQPYSVVSRIAISEPQFNAVLALQPDLDDLFDQVLDAGFRKGNYNQQVMNNGDVFTQALLLRPDLSEIALVSGNDDGAMTYIIGRYYITLASPTGEIAYYDLQNNVLGTLPNLPDTTAPVSLADPSKVNCLTNCLILETGTSLLTEFAPILGKIGTISDCVSFLADPSSTDAAASCAAGVQNSVPFAGTVVSAVNCYNRSVANPDFCKCTDSLWEGTTMPIAKTEACKKTPCVNGIFATYDQAVYACPFCTKCVGGTGGSTNPWDHCKPTGATPPAECQQTTAAFTLFPELVAGQADDIFDGMKICMLIPRDPNAKYGAEGNLVPGQEVTYRITYENEGAGTAYGVYITDILDANLDETTLVLGSNAIYIPSTRMIFWTIGELASGGEGEISFKVRVKQGVPGGTPIFNRAVVYFPSAPEMTPTNAVVNYVQPITALPQKVETNYKTPKPITLQGLDVGGAPLTFAVTQQPIFGKLTGTAPNLTYTPGENVTGQDKFSYISNNGISQSEPAEVLITIHPSANDTKAPEILWTFPADDATGIPYRSSPALEDADGGIYAPFPLIQFSEAMDPDTITTTNLTLQDGLGAPVEITVFYNQLVNQVVLYPREAFAKGQTYTLIIQAEVSDLMGNLLGADHSFNFTIGDSVDKLEIFLPMIRR